MNALINIVDNLVILTVMKGNLLETLFCLSKFRQHNSLFLDVIQIHRLTQVPRFCIDLIQVKYFGKVVFSVILI